jgi:amino acid permease
MQGETEFGIGALLKPLRHKLHWSSDTGLVFPCSFSLIYIYFIYLFIYINGWARIYPHCNTAYKTFCVLLDYLIVLFAYVIYLLTQKKLYSLVGTNKMHSLKWMIIFYRSTLR